MRTCVMVVLAAMFAGSFSGEAAIAGERRAIGTNVRIGVVRIQDVFEKYDYATEMRKKIMDAFKKDGETITALKRSIQNKQTALQNDNMIRRGSTDWKKKMLEIEMLKVDLEDLDGKFKKEYQKQMAGYYKIIYEKFRLAIETFAKTYKFDLVISAPKNEISTEALQSNNPGVILSEIVMHYVQYIGENVDITQHIITEMNKRYEAEKARQ